jgi:hypothetical protein
MPTMVEHLLESMGDGGIIVLLLVICVLERSYCLLAVKKRSNPLVRCMYMFLTKLQSVYVMVRQEEFQILT